MSKWRQAGRNTGTLESAKILAVTHLVRTGASSSNLSRKLHMRDANHRSGENRKQSYHEEKRLFLAMKIRT